MTTEQARPGNTGTSLDDINDAETLWDAGQTVLGRLRDGFRQGDVGPAKRDINNDETICPEPGNLEAATAAKPAEYLDAGGRFRVLEHLGAGGMGSVYLCEDTKLGRHVAVKKLRKPTDTTAATFRALIQEARALALLDHRNIVKVWELNDDPDNPCIVMEYVEGGNLAARIARAAPLPFRRAYSLLEPVCQGLQLAHEHNIVHRDIKPSNILIAADGTPKLTDFGLALAPDREASAIGGRSAGSPGFMAPEQQYNASAVDHRADIYALGATLYQMLTARSPAELRFDDLSASVRDLLKDAMAPDPAARIQTVGAFLERLAEANEARDRPATPSEWPTGESESVDQPYKDILARVPPSLVDEIFRQLLSGNPPREQQREVWLDALHILGPELPGLDQVIAAVAATCRADIEKAHASRERLTQQQRDLAALIEQRVAQRGGQLSAADIAKLRSAAELSGCDATSVERECANASLRLRLSQALATGKGRLTRESYASFAAEAPAAGWSARDLDDFIASYAHLRTTAGWFRVKLADALHPEGGVSETVTATRAGTGDTATAERAGIEAERNRARREREQAERERRAAEQAKRVLEEQKRRVAEEQARLARERQQAEEAARRAEARQRAIEEQRARDEARERKRMQRAATPRLSARLGKAAGLLVGIVVLLAGLIPPLQRSGTISPEVLMGSLLAAAAGALIAYLAVVALGSVIRRMPKLIVVAVIGVVLLVLLAH